MLRDGSGAAPTHPNASAQVRSGPVVGGGHIARLEACTHARCGALLVCQALRPAAGPPWHGATPRRGPPGSAVLRVGSGATPKQLQVSVMFFCMLDLMLDLSG